MSIKSKIHLKLLSKKHFRQYVVVISRTSFRVNLDSLICLNIKELLGRSRHHIWSLIDSTGIWTHDHLVLKRTLNYLAKVAKWLSCVLSTYLHGGFDCMLLLLVGLRVWIPLLSLKLPIWRLLQARSSLTFRQTIECRFTLKLVRDMTITCSQMHRTDRNLQYSSVIWLVWLNDWVSAHEQSGCGFESRFCHLNTFSVSSKAFFRLSDI